MPAIDRARTWILIANASRARLFRAAGVGGSWTLALALEHPESRAKTRDLVTDGLGRSRKPSAGARTAMEQEVPPKRVEAIRFARALAVMLKRGLDNHLYDHLVIVTPPSFLGILRGCMSKHVAARIAAVFEKDYTAFEAREAKGHVAHAA